MRSVANTDKLYELANYLMNARGYLVLGCLEDTHDVGDVVKVLWNVDVDQPLRLIARTDRADWKEQSQTAARGFPNKEYQRALYVERTSPVDSDLAWFFRAITD